MRRPVLPWHASPTITGQRGFEDGRAGRCAPGAPRGVLDRDRRDDERVSRRSAGPVRAAGGDVAHLDRAGRRGRDRGTVRARVARATGRRGIHRRRGRERIGGGSPVHAVGRTRAGPARPRCADVPGGLHADARRGRAADARADAGISRRRRRRLGRVRPGHERGPGVRQQADVHQRARRVVRERARPAPAALRRRADGRRGQRWWLDLDRVGAGVPRHHRGWVRPRRRRGRACAAQRGRRGRG